MVGNDLKLKWFVETENGGYGSTYTFDEACKMAQEDSLQESCVMWVRKAWEDKPMRIYYCGVGYEVIAEKTR